MPSAFLESPRFPDEITFHASVGPQFRTEVATGLTGYQQTNATMPDPLHVFDITQAMREIDISNTPGYGYRVVRDFFNVVKGKAIGFRARNWWDYKDDGLGILGTGVGNGTTTVFQIAKRYVAGALSTDKAIRKPVSGTLVVKVNGVTVSNYTTDFTTGLVTFAAAPANGAVLTCAYEYDLPVRFDRDLIRVHPDSGGLAIVEGLAMLEYRL